jgi:putative intracellular protease/amidase
MKSTARVEIVVFDGVEELDALGPYEFFSVARQAGADIEVRLVTYKEADRGPSCPRSGLSPARPAR